MSWAELSKHGTFGEEIGEKVVHDGEVIRFEVADILITEAVERYLKLNDPDAMFVYLGSIDEAGHEHGAMSAQYVRALEDVDGHLGRILVALSRRPSYAEENWLVIVTTDHGHVDQGGHGGDSDVERGIFVILNGPEVAAGRELSDPALVDIAPTVLDHLGLPQDTCFEGASLQVSAGQSGTEPMAV